MAKKTAAPVEVKPVAKRNGKATSKTAEARRQENESRYQANLAEVRERGLPSENTVKVITRVVKKGKKTILTTSQVEKTKRPSKLLRKARRIEAAKQLGHAAGNPTEKKE